MKKILRNGNIKRSEMESIWKIEIINTSSANFKNKKLFAANYTREKKSYYKNDIHKITDKKTF